VICLDITGIISVVSSFLATFGGIIVSSKLTTYRIEQLEKKIEKLADVAERVSLIEERFKTMNSRIDSLENDLKQIRNNH
jgi:outer membrane murein-binding lipoprotein Lpp